MSDAFWAGLFFLAGLLIKDWLDQRRFDRSERQRLKLATVAAEKVDQVAQKQAEAAHRVEAVKVLLKADTEALKADTKAQTDKLDALVVSVEEVKLQTNGLKDQLVAEVRKGAYAKGLKEGIEENKPS